MDDSLVSRYNNYLAPFKQRLEEFKQFTPEKAEIKDKKKIAYHNAIKLYNTLLSIYFNDYNNISDEKKENMGGKYNPNNLPIKGYRFLESRKKR